MKTSARISFSTAIIVCFMVLIVSGCKEDLFEGKWIGGFDYGNASYEMELTLDKKEEGKLSGNLRVLESGYEVETLSLKSVVLSGDSLVIQTSVIEGRGARLVLKSDGGKLVGRMQETYLDRLQGESWEVVLEKEKD